MYNVTETYCWAPGSPHVKWLLSVRPSVRSSI